ncbi:hypothetical protein C8A00DRAFT_31116 [Chaetomidium leptoderma]|uniref:Uncharacterized protein n=1 Tax=Chaetomidium leptoderma TaxID=669021 RepID=A0AAN7A0S9_9PEZI|nr:hypothetical protein C8A00DRAFT_31116 [Chaetomidium leptoderma]
MSLQKAKDHWMRCIRDEESRASIQPIIDGAQPLAFVTGPPHCGKTSSIAFSIVCQTNTRVVYVAQSRYAASRSCRFAQETFGAERQIGEYSPAATSTPPPPDAQLVYMTYGDIVCKVGDVTRLLAGATHIVLADVHEESVDQELACYVLHQAQLYKPGVQAAIVMVTTYEKSGALDSDCLFMQGSEEGETIEPCRVQLPRRFTALTLQYEPGLTATAVDVPRYQRWATGAVERMARQIRKKGRMVVFAPSEEILWGLNKNLANHNTDVVVLDHRYPVELDEINRRSAPVIILMRPYFGHRLHIRCVQIVVCPAFDEQPILYEPAGKEIQTVRRLPNDRIQFMADHAPPIANATVRFAFTKSAHHALPHTDLALFTYGNCLEYYLKAGLVAPNESPFPGHRKGMCLRLTVSYERIEWVFVGTSTPE